MEILGIVQGGVILSRTGNRGTGSIPTLIALIPLIWHLLRIVGSHQRHISVNILIRMIVTALAQALTLTLITAVVKQTC
jgi:hypothetical protein